MLYVCPGRWVRAHPETLNWEANLGAPGDRRVFTLIKSAQWHDLLMQRYWTQCAWLTAMTEAIKQVSSSCLLVCSPGMS